MSMRHSNTSTGPYQLVTCADSQTSSGSAPSQASLPTASPTRTASGTSSPERQAGIHADRHAGMQACRHALQVMTVNQTRESPNKTKSVQKQCVKSLLTHHHGQGPGRTHPLNRTLAPPLAHPPTHILTYPLPHPLPRPTTPGRCLLSSPPRTST
jgi:hypothetical protein